MKKLIFIFICLLVFIVPRGTFAEEYYSSPYVNYYSDLSHTTSLGWQGGFQYYSLSTQTSSSQSFNQSWYYMDSVDVSSLAKGLIRIPFMVLYDPMSIETTTDQIFCSKWGCSNSELDFCYEYTCWDVTYDDTDIDYYDVNVVMSARAYFDGTSNWISCSFEGSNLVCPIKDDVTNLTAIYILSSIVTENSQTYRLGLSKGFSLYYNNTQAIIDSQDETTDAVNGLNDSLTDSSGNDDSDNSNAIDDFENNIASNSTISSLITMPITLYQKILNSVNGSCSTFTLGSLLGTNVTFPCINPSDYLGSSLWSIIDVICSGLLIFAISKRFINIFESFTSMSNTRDEVGD